MNSEKSTHILTLNAGSSSIKLALFEVRDTPEQLLECVIENIGEATADFVINSATTSEIISKSVVAQDHVAAASILVDYVTQQISSDSVSAIGHRIVHGGPKYYRPQVIDKEMLMSLRELTHFDPEHLPTEIKLIEIFQKLFPNVEQVACFDTAFHHDLPTEARLLSIPRRYEAMGIRRYGFHGLSCEFMMHELSRLEGPKAVNSGRIILAHLGNGVSLTAVQQGKSIDTTMGLTPASGVPMSTRSGDLDPGLALYLSHTSGLNADQFDDLVNFRSGLLGISETTSDMKELLKNEGDDLRAKEAVNLFCYQVKKSIGSLAAAMGGVDMLVFTGGMGENAPKIRARICEGLQFLGIEVEEMRNASNTGVISQDTGRVVIRVIHADEAFTIANDVHQLITKRIASDETEQ